MPIPLANGHRPDEDRRNPPAPERPGLEEMIAEAEAPAIAIGRCRPASRTIACCSEATTSP